MSKASKLTLAFINKRPASAARVLESLSIEDAAAFVDSIPTRYATKLLIPINAPTAAAVIGHISASSAAAIIRERSSSQRDRFCATPQSMQDPLCS